MAVLSCLLFLESSQEDQEKREYERLMNHLTLIALKEEALKLNVQIAGKLNIIGKDARMNHLVQREPHKEQRMQKEKNIEAIKESFQPSSANERVDYWI
ncbi:hypothetical protein QQ045_028631 [Rhodiola kirilowii]